MPHAWLLPLLAIFVFTAPGGLPIYISDAQVVGIISAPPNICAPLAMTIIDTVCNSYCVLEMPSTVAERLGWKR